MSLAPPRWTEEQLNEQATISAAAFRTERLAPTESWKKNYSKARAGFEALFSQLGELAPESLSDANVAQAYKLRLGESLRYLAGPPISDDDLKVIADVSTLAPGVVSSSPESVRKIFSVIEKVIDPYRFPWVLEKRSPTTEERSAAILASSVLLTAQKVATERRNNAKLAQELKVREFFVQQGFTEVRARPIKTIVNGPKKQEFCSECVLGDRKADVVVRLRDSRLMPIECKVSNSALNSLKRINNDAGSKAVHWSKTFGTAQVVPAAVISGVFNVSNLVRAQEAGLTIFWAHDLAQLGAFVAEAKWIEL